MFTCFPTFFFYWKTNHHIGRRFQGTDSRQHRHQDYQNTLHHRNHPLELSLLDHPDCVYLCPRNRSPPKCQHTGKYYFLFFNRLQFTLKVVIDSESDDKKLKQ